MPCRSLHAKILRTASMTEDHMPTEPTFPQARGFKWWLVQQFFVGRGVPRAPKRCNRLSTSFKRALGRLVVTATATTLKP